MNGTEITLPQMLDCRERRNMVQDMLIDKYRKTVVSYCMNIPGPIKTNTKIRSAFESGLGQLKEALKQQNITVLEEYNIREVTGDEWIAAVDCDAETAKDLAMQIEESHPLGRLFDMDVLGPDGRKLSRMRYRKCLICERQAQECARSRTHTVTEMQDAIDVMLNDYFPEIPFPQSLKGGTMSKSYRPVYHASVPSGWSNDPNGTIYYNGKAHLFFQHYPYKPAWGIMHWGHFTTQDLVHWEVLPVALCPDQDYEALCGCCSGSAIEKDGDLYLMYTAAQPDLQRQCLARSEDGGITFVKREDNPILTADMLSEEVSSYDFRDPRLFKKDGYYYFLAGARVIDLGADEEELAARTRKWDKLRASSSIRYSPSIFESVAQDDVRDEAQGDTPGDSPSEEPHSGVSSKIKSPSVGDVFGQDPTIAGFGNLILCRSNDLEHWEYVGHLLHRQPQFEEDFYNLNGVYECPDYLVIDGQEIVLSSPQNLPQMDNLYQNVHSGLYLLGKLDFETGRYDLEKIGELDSGFDFYAAQTLHMPDGRPIMIAWKEMWDRNYPTQAEGWAGTYTFPRELSLDGDCLIQKPARELDAYCKNKVTCESLTVTDEVSVPGIDGTVARILLTMEPGTASKAGIKLFAGPKHETVIYYDREEGVLAIDRSASGLKITGKEENVTVRKLDVGHPESIELEMLLDVSSLEVFINGGRHVMTANVYPDPEDTDVRFFAQGGSAKFENIEKFDVVV